MSRFRRYALRTAASLLLTLPLAAMAAPAHRVILFVWDGMRPDAISAEDTPNLLALGQRGARFDDNHATYPTFTMANASSFATGAFPGALGFYGNRFWAPGTQGANAEGEDVDFSAPIFVEDYQILRDLDAHYEQHLLELPTLFSAAHQAGLTTAVIGKSGPAFLQDHHEGGLVLDENVALPLTFARELQAAGYPLPAHTPHAYAKDELRLGENNGAPTALSPTRTLNDGVTSDASADIDTPPTAANAWMMKVFLEQVLPKHRPDLSVVWLRNPDTTQHLYGVGSHEFHRALQAQDALLGQLLVKLKALGMDSTTNVIVVSDHAHSNIAGHRDLFPLRAIHDGTVGDVDNAQGYSVSGTVRLADVLSRAGQPAFDGVGCLYVPVMSGIRADGTPLHATHQDDDGRVCGKPGPYTTPSYKLPAHLPKGSLVIASNGGTEYLYQPEHDPAVIQRAVRLLQSREYVGALFVARRYGDIPGTLPAETVHLENSDRGPDIILSYNWDADATVQGFRGTEYASMANERGEHGSFSPIDVHNTLLAAGPGFREGFRDSLPSGNVDVAPTIAALLGLPLTQAQGRVLRESLNGDLAQSGDDYQVQNVTLHPQISATGLHMRRIDDTRLPSIIYTFRLQLKQLRNGKQTWTYFDYAKPERK